MIYVYIYTSNTLHPIWRYTHKGFRPTPPRAGAVRRGAGGEKAWGGVWREFLVCIFPWLMKDIGYSCIFLLLGHNSVRLVAHSLFFEKRCSVVVIVFVNNAQICQDLLFLSVSDKQIDAEYKTIKRSANFCLELSYRPDW